MQPDAALEAVVRGRLGASGVQNCQVLAPGRAWQAVLSEDQSPINWRLRIASVLQELPVDWVIVPSGWRPRLAVFDMDSTLISIEVIDELAALADVKPAVAAITAAAMRGEIDFKTSFTARMGYLRGLEAKQIKSIADDLPLMPGSIQLLNWLQEVGCRSAIISGGFDYFAKRVQQCLGMDAVVANHLEIIEGRLTGRIVGDLVDAEHKSLALQRLAAQWNIPLSNCVAIGDGANDLLMLQAAGFGLAFHAKPRVQQQAPWSVNYIAMDQLRYLLAPRITVVE